MAKAFICDQDLRWVRANQCFRYLGDWKAGANQTKKKFEARELPVAKACRQRTAIHKTQLVNGNDREELLCSVLSSLLPVLSVLLLSLLLACVGAPRSAVTRAYSNRDLNEDDVEVRGIAKS